MKKRKFPIKKGQACPSTHGGAGYCGGDYWDNGVIVCSFCGTRIKNPNPTGGYKDTPTYPSFIGGVPPEKTSEGLREIEKNQKKWYQFWR